MENPTGHADAEDGKLPSLLEEEHDAQTEDGPGHTVKEGVDAAAKGRGQDDAHEQDETDVALTRQGIEGDDRNQIGQPQFRLQEWFP